jgi:hypothetical protein
MAQESSEDFPSAFARVVAMSCLLWTRDKVPVEELHKEARLHRLPSEKGSADELWRTSFPGGHLTVAQHNDGTFGCSAMVAGVTAAEIVTTFEKTLMLGGIPANMRFQAVNVVEKSGLVDRLYRQPSDARISALLTVDPQASDEATAATLTFFYEREMFTHPTH